MLGLAPGGVYLADAVTRAAGELLPHLFTLTGRVRRLFSVTLLYPHGQLPVKKYGALCCPDVPPVLKDERQTGRLQCDKGNSFNRQLKIENRDNHIKMVRYSSLLLFFQSNLFSIMLCICSTLLKINYIDI